MKVITVADDGTTTNDPAWTLHRLLAHAHGDED